MKNIFDTLFKITIFVSFTIVIPVMVHLFIQEIKDYYPLTTPKMVALPNASDYFPPFHFNYKGLSLEQIEEQRKEEARVKEQYKEQIEQFKQAEKTHNEYYIALNKLQKNKNALNFLVATIFSIIFMLASLFSTSLPIRAGFLSGGIINTFVSYFFYSWGLTNFLNLLFLIAVFAVLIIVTLKFIPKKDCCYALHNALIGNAIISYASGMI